MIDTVPPRSTRTSGSSSLRSYLLVSNEHVFQQIPFPIKLHVMLEDMARGGSQNIVSWQPHGKAFRVHQPEVFAGTIIPRYFKLTKYKSFQRQLNLYGFHRIRKGLDKGAYCHTLFIRNKKSMSLRIIRQRIKGTAGRGGDAELVLQDDPHFYSETAAEEDQHQSKNSDRGQDRRRSLSEMPSLISYPETIDDASSSTPPPVVTRRSTTSSQHGCWVGGIAEFFSSKDSSFNKKGNPCIEKKNILQSAGGNIVNTAAEETWCFPSEDEDHGAGGEDKAFGKNFFAVDTSDFSSLLVNMVMEKGQSISYMPRSE
jgi:hypothetical protein